MVVEASITRQVAIALLGLTNAMVLAVIAFGALWPMLLATVHGFAAVEPRLYQVSRALGLSNREVIWKIALPSAMPDFALVSTMQPRGDQPRAIAELVAGGRIYLQILGERHPPVCLWVERAAAEIPAEEPPAN